jgi:hypothetical protein
MNDSHGLTSNDPSAEHGSDMPVSSKGKGKAVDETPMGDASMGEDDDSSDEEETDAEEPVSMSLTLSELSIKHPLTEPYSSPLKVPYDPSSKPST